MKIEVNLTKTHMFFLVGLVLSIAGLFIVTAYGTNNPRTLGHTPTEINPGIFGKDMTADSWAFKGKLELQSNSPAPLTINDGNAGDAFISWMQGGSSKYSVGIDTTGTFRVNSASGTASAGNGITVTSDGKVGIGISTPGRSLEVLTPDRIRITASSAATQADNPSLTLMSLSSSNRWNIVKRGPTYIGSGPGDSNDLVISYSSTSESGSSTECPVAGCPTTIVPTIILKDDGKIVMPKLAGTGNKVCIDAAGVLSRCT